MNGDHTVVTASWQMVDLVRPSPSTISPWDIARSLARQGRFNGHTSFYFSVA
ncbi:MAG: hypothetical protein KAU50_06715 [Candidatus Marinimicrobia bacterium]|nr:hypothetical protein [Candidatus Neomarinimicrobiota bacterium]